jgi:hypothetical protein
MKEWACIRASTRAQKRVANSLLGVEFLMLADRNAITMPLSQFRPAVSFVEPGRGATMLRTITCIQAGVAGSKPNLSTTRSARYCNQII